MNQLRILDIGFRVENREDYLASCIVHHTPSLVIAKEA